MSGQLERLLESATPGPWTFNDGTDPRGHKGEFRAPSPHNGFMLVGPWTNDHDARLIALAPDLARLLVDAMAFIRGDTPDDECDVPGCTDPWCCEHDAEALLARFAVLEQRAGEGQA